MTESVEEKDPSAELEELRERREKILRLQAEQTSKATAARALLEQPSTYPRPRKVVEAELTTAERLDLPMLADELALAERAIADLEEALGTPEAQAPALPLLSGP